MYPMDEQGIFDRFISVEIASILDLPSKRRAKICASAASFEISTDFSFGKNSSPTSSLNVASKS
jgi:hypothetical protein